MKMEQLTHQIISYENGDMNEDEIILFFQELVDTGLAWSLQGHYGRTASWLIEEGYVYPASSGRNKEVHGIS